MCLVRQVLLRMELGRGKCASGDIMLSFTVFVLLKAFPRLWHIT